MNAGRELDAIVAEEVMGWVRNFSPYDVRDPNKLGRNGWDLPDGTSWVAEPLPYSTDIAAAWEVVERICQGKAWFQLNTGNSSYDVVIRLYDDLHSREKWFTATENTAPLTICRAALDYVGWKEPQPHEGAD